MCLNKYIGLNWLRNPIALLLVAMLCVGSVQAEETPVATAVPNQANEEVMLPAVDRYFQELYAKNSDIVGWLVAGESIDYPVVQRDNDFYLSHDFNGAGDVNGTLFLNEANTIWPQDDILMIHGHNMSSGEMFGKLKQYEALSYACKYPVIIFRTIYDSEDVFYTPIAAFNASMDGDNSSYFNILQFNFDDDPEGFPAVSSGNRQSSTYQAYIDSLLTMSIWKSPVDVTTDDQLLMLVTCSYYQPNGRFILVCRKLRDKEGMEEIKNLFHEASLLIEPGSADPRHMGWNQQRNAP
jgi:sortase B